MAIFGSAHIHVLVFYLPKVVIYLTLRYTSSAFSYGVLTIVAYGPEKRSQGIIPICVYKSPVWPQEFPPLECRNGGLNGDKHNPQHNLEHDLFEHLNPISSYSKGIRRFECNLYAWVGMAFTSKSFLMTWQNDTVPLRLSKTSQSFHLTYEYVVVGFPSISSRCFYYLMLLPCMLLHTISKNVYITQKIFRTITWK